MIRFFKMAACLLSLCAASVNSAEWPSPYSDSLPTVNPLINWEGPQASLIRTDQGMRIEVKLKDPEGIESIKQLPVVFLGLNPQNFEYIPEECAPNADGPTSTTCVAAKARQIDCAKDSGSVSCTTLKTVIDWTKFDRELTAALDVGIPIIDMHLVNHLFIDMVKFNQHFDEFLSRRPSTSNTLYIALRYDSWFSETKDIPREVGVGPKEGGGIRIQDTSLDGNIGSSPTKDVENYSYVNVPKHPIMSDEWITAQISGTQSLLNILARSGLSKRIIMLRPTFLHDGEWFSPPKMDGKEKEEDKTDKLLVSGFDNATFPWTKPYSFFYVIDNQNIRDKFKDWVNKTSFSNSVVSYPKPAETIGIGGSMGSVFLGDASRANVNAFLYNTFRSNQIYYAQSLLAKTIKTLTGNKSLVAVNSGYLFSLAHYNGSTHLGFGDVLKDPNIDVVVSPYSYEESRKIGNGFIPQGPMDSADLYNKLWLHEDDSRPYWLPDGEGHKTTRTFAEDLSLLTRNMGTALMHRTSAYLFDLNMRGWFGNPLNDPETKTLWESVSYINKIKPNAKNLLKKELAVFIDEKSYSLHPFHGMASASTGTFSKELTVGTLNELSKLGIPYKFYRLDDINSPTFDASPIKTAIFLNSFYVDAKTFENINSKLLNSNRHIIVQYGFALYDENLNFSTKRMSDLLGMSVKRNASPNTTTYSDVTPWFSADSSNSIAGFNNVFYKKLTNYHVSFLAFPQAKGDLFKLLLSKNNLFTFTTMTQDEKLVIDVDHDLMMVHGVFKAEGKINLPSYYSVYELIKGNEISICTTCTSFTIKPSTTATRIFRLVADKVPKTLLRIDYGGYIGQGNNSFCSLDSGAHMNSCGYTQSNYDTATKVYSLDGYLNLGYCHCGPTGLFKFEWSPGLYGGAISRNGSSYCSLNSAQALTACGYSSAQYANAPIGNVVAGHMIYDGECSCK